MAPRPNSPLTHVTAPLLVALACVVGACSGSGAGDLTVALREPCAATAFDSTRGVTVLFGGLGGTRSSETWEWDGTTWTRRATTGPSPRQGHALAFDSGRGVTVLFGGFEGSGNYSRETWEWDGATWTLRASNGPSPRYGHTMVYDSVQGSVFLFGGFDGNPDQETWEYTGSNARWTRRATSGPGSRLRHAMVFDAIHDVTLLFGGYGVDGVFNDDLWQWSAQTRRWTQLSASGPSGRYLHAMVCDGASGKTILFGGLATGYAYANDTWVWDGAAWTQQPGTPVPSPRAAAAMAFDSTRNVAVLFGGFDGSFNSETWEWDGSAWSQRNAAFSIPLSAASAHGFLVLEHAGKASVREFRLDADASGMHGQWAGAH